MSDLIKIALSQVGISEIKGEKHNPEVVKYFTEAGFDKILDDETAWCSAFMNWCAKKAGLTRSKQLNARSWVGIGETVENPEMGDIVVFWREAKDSWKGHVGIFLKYEHNGKTIQVLGGNQGNRVCIQEYQTSRVLSFQRLTPVDGAKTEGSESTEELCNELNEKEGLIADLQEKLQASEANAENLTKELEEIKAKYDQAPVAEEKAKAPAKKAAAKKESTKTKTA